LLNVVGMTNLTGMALLRSQRGLLAKVADGLGITRGAVAMWPRIPAERVRRVSEITGIPRHELRPDLWDAPARGDAA
jgi:DNA-binding transcriptional regulator YdaS (Cro superfamily)